MALTLALTFTLNSLLSSVVARLLWKWLVREKRQRTSLSSLISIVLGASVGLVTPIAFCALTEALGVIVWNEPGRLLLKMIGGGFWFSLLGAYFGMRDARR